jgi:hypothetical protein
VQFAPPQLVIAAANALDGAHPVSIISIPALLRAAHRQGLDPTGSPVPFGSKEESALLQDYFVLPRPPEADRPYFAPWSKSADTSWQTKKYAGGGLQRQRNHLVNQGRVFVQHKNQSPVRDLWELNADAGKEMLGGDKQKPVRLADLAIWFGRDIDVESLDDAVVGTSQDGVERLIGWFKSDFAPNVGDLVGSLYTDGVPSEYAGVAFADTPVDEGTYELLGSIPPAPVVSGSFVDLVVAIEKRMTSAGYVLAEGLVRRVITAWMRGDIVVLVGQPGTGKSLFANLMGRAMEAELDLDAPLVVPIRADFDEAEFIGYERLDGSPEFRDFTLKVLRTDDPLEARVVILEEFNLAAVETYLSSVLVATQDQERLVRLPAGQQAQLPVDTFIIATCNSYRDEPETRTRISSPTKRRSTIITMPNVLGDQFENDPDNAVLQLALELIHTERKRISARGDKSASAQFDRLRLANLESVKSLNSLSPATQDKLRRVAASVLETSAGRSWFTMGLLRDIALNVAHAPREEHSELVALGESVADKLIHQVRGAFSDVEVLREVCAGLPNADEIERLLDRMMDGPSDELLSLL